MQDTRKIFNTFKRSSIELKKIDEGYILYNTKSGMSVKITGIIKVTSDYEEVGEAQEFLCPRCNTCFKTVEARSKAYGGICQSCHVASTD